MLAQAFQCTYFVIHRLPVIARVADGVVLNNAGGHVADELLVLELVERETVATFGQVVVLLNISDGSGAHLQLHIPDRNSVRR